MRATDSVLPPSVFSALFYVPVFPIRKVPTKVAYHRHLLSFAAVFRKVPTKVAYHRHLLSFAAV